jgi:hypothetical protein
MASPDYDEDLETNPFFVAVRRDFPDLFQQCLAEGLILAVPRRGSVAGIETFDRDAILRHVLVTSDDFSLTRFHSLDGAVEVITGGVGDVVRVVNVGEDCDTAKNDETSTKLLFTETFYNDDMNKLQLWCLADPLVAIWPRKVTDHPADPLDNPSSLLPDSASVKECIDFLSQYVGGRPLLIKIQLLAKDFEKTVKSSRAAKM